MLTYLPNDPHPGGKYSFSYQWLRDDYLRFTMMSDEEFLADLIHILHFTVFVCYIKEMQTQWVLADTGIVHELVHLLLEERNRALGKPDAEIEVTSTPLDSSLLTSVGNTKKTSRRFGPSKQRKPHGRGLSLNTSPDGMTRKALFVLSQGRSVSTTSKTVLGLR